MIEVKDLLGGRVMVSPPGNSETPTVCPRGTVVGILPGRVAVFAVQLDCGKLVFRASNCVFAMVVIGHAGETI